MLDSNMSVCEVEAICFTAVPSCVLKGRDDILTAYIYTFNLKCNKKYKSPQGKSVALVARWTAGEKVKRSILRQGHDS